MVNEPILTFLFSFSYSHHIVSSLDGEPIGPEAVIKSQKYCKFAGSALQYDDIKTAVMNLEKALKILNTGSE